MTKKKMDTDSIKPMNWTN